MESIFLLALPIIVSILTEAIKKLRSIRFSENKATTLRFFAISLAFVGTVLASIASGTEVPLAEIETYAEVVLVFIATQVPYIYGKIKGEKEGRGEY